MSSSQTFPGYTAAIALTIGVGAQASALLPERAADHHLGVASCASSVCHGSVQPSAVSGVLMNEFVTWSHEDSHSKAYQSLLSNEGRGIAGKLGLGSAETSKLCLDCHADNVPPERRGKKFALTDGVGCESCHGGAERWISSHTAKSNYAADLKAGMYPTAQSIERASLCLSCHYGTSDKFATHRLMAAGHPRLSLELDTFLALEPAHYRIDARYRARKPVYTRTQTWMVGQLKAADAQLTILEGPIAKSGRTFPELALFNCASCHDSSMLRREWRPRQLTSGTEAGSVLLNDASLRMAWVIAACVDPRDGDRIKELVQSLQHDAVHNWAHVPASSATLRAAVNQTSRKIEAGPTSPSPRGLLDRVLQAGVDGEFRDYLGAEQAVMAIDLLLMDAGMADRLAAQRDVLFRLLKNQDAYRSPDFSAALSSLREELRQ